MPKIVDLDQLVVGTELTIDTSAKTFTLNEAGNLIYKDGVSIQALYSKFVELWTTTTYNKFDFPMYAIDPRSGQYQFGTDGATFNGWKPANDATRRALRDGGWSEFSAAGALNREYVGIIALASGFPVGAQFYYQKVSGGPAINFTYTDAPNEGIQVLGDAANGNFDNRTFFKIFSREANFTYDDAVLADVGETSTGTFKVSLPLSVGSDLKISANDATVAANAPYTSITVTYFGTNQVRNIGGVNYNFRVIIDGAGATKEQIYTKIQYLLRQSSDIDNGAGTVIGKTADSLLYFVGDTLKTTAGVYIDNFNANDINSISFLPFGSTAGNEITFPFTASGTLNFNSFLVGLGSYYRMYFTSLPGAGDDYGTSGAVTVQDKDSVAIQGAISAGSVSFTFSYDSNNQGGRTPGTDAQVTVVAGRPGSAKPVVTTYTITRTTGQNITLTAEQDRAYVNI
jgi:hypothetical protein